jgi:UTP--glucose-1-phosphate uridylyltransferase
MTVTALPSQHRVNRALIPVAGRGTRMYPATAAIPKELLPIGNRPLLEFALDEIADAGIEEVVLVTARGKSAIEDFVEDWSDRHPGLLKFAYVRQRAARGLGDAVACAEHVMADAPFAVLLPDDLLIGPDSTLARLVRHHAASGGAAVALQPISDEETSAYGVPDVGEARGDVYPIHRLVEKPGPADAPSRLGVVGRYVLPARVFRYLRNAQAGARGEVQLTDAIDALARHEGVFGVPLTQRRIDCGAPAGFLEAQLCQMQIRVPGAFKTMALSRVASAKRSPSPPAAALSAADDCA